MQYNNIDYSLFNTEKNVNPFIRKGFKKRVKIYLALTVAAGAILLMSSCSNKNEFIVIERSTEDMVRIDTMLKDNNAMFVGDTLETINKDGQYMRTICKDIFTSVYLCQNCDFPVSQKMQYSRYCGHCRPSKSIAKN